MRIKKLSILFLGAILLLNICYAHALPMNYTFEGTIGDTRPGDPVLYTPGEVMSLDLQMNLPEVSSSNFPVNVTDFTIGDTQIYTGTALGYAEIFQYKGFKYYSIAMGNLLLEWEPGDYAFLHTKGSIVSLYFNVYTTPAPVPEPVTLLLFGSGLVGMVINKKQKKV